MLNLKKLMNAKGFTLVELLIVIAVIGILAVAVLAALDPIEQLKKSRDTAKLADARELISAYQRFYASKNCFPTDYPGCAATTGVFGLTNVAAVTADLSEMTTEGELKGTFQSKTNVANGWLRVTLPTSGALAVCFPAESKNARSQALGPSYTVAATGITQVGAFACDANYNPQGNDDACMVCVQ